MSDAASVQRSTVRTTPPEHWKLIPFRWCCSIANGQVDPTVERMAALPMIAPNHIESGTGRLLEYETAGEQGAISGKYYYPEGTVIYSKIRPALRKVCIAPSAGLCSADMYPIYSSKLTPKYLLYQLLSERFSLFAVTESDRVAMPKLNRETLGSFVMTVPPIPEQRAITEFLDREISKIDALIAKQEELIERVEDKSKAFIARTIVGGLHTGRDTRDSGFEWIGRVPAHWIVKRLKIVSTFVTSGSRGWAQYYSDTGDTFIRIGNLNRASIELALDDIQFVTVPKNAEGARTRVEAGDVLISITAYLGAIGVAPTAIKNAYISQHVAMVRLDQQQADSRFVGYFLLSGAGQTQFALNSYGGTKEGLSLDDIREIVIAVPPLSEQEEIVAAIDTALLRSAGLVEKAKSFISTLRERRSALITAAVTGQIDVRPRLEPTNIAANDNRQAFRAVVGAEIVSRHGSSKTLGRVKLQKLLYLAEVHAGVHELAGVYAREAAGPLARDLLSDTERGMAAAGYFSTVAPVNTGEGYTYARIGKAGSHNNQLASLLGQREVALASLIDRLKDYDTRQVEAITTLYAVWNDALLDGAAPDDDRIIRGVLEEWHPEKPDKFTTSDLKTWLAWMRRNGLVPTGTGSRTQIDRLFV